jgi:pSer/pThr/pTyr-binding forkhead associated (FHA) protein
VGRAPDADLLLADVTVSRRHAAVHGERQRYVLYDAGSRNGAYLNGHRVTAAVLDEGDEIVVGGSHSGFEPSRAPRPLAGDLRKEG